jgi:hypothetical protein
VNLRIKIIALLLFIVCIGVGGSKIINDISEYNQREHAIREIRWQLLATKPNDKINEKIPDMLDRLRKTGLSYPTCVSILNNFVSVNKNSLALVDAMVSSIEIQQNIEKMKHSYI